MIYLALTNINKVWGFRDESSNIGIVSCHRLIRCRDLEVNKSYESALSQHNTERLI